MTDDSQDPWNSPAELLDSIEMLLWRTISRESVYEDPDGPVTAVIDVGDIDVLGSIYLRKLRKALRNAGLDVPESGEWDRMPEGAWDPPPPRERDPRIAVILAEAGHPHPHGLPASAKVSPVVLTAATATGEIRETALYRWWDEGDALLYVGISEHLDSRTRGHARGSSWMDFAVRSAVERYPSRAAALAAEEAAIKAERPLFNHIHNDTPEARKRLVEYLLERGRIDLLAPAVSRG